MKVKSVAHLYLTPTGWTAPPPEALTDVTAAAPAVVTAVAMPASAVEGAYVVFADTAQADLDGYAFQITNPDTTAKTFELEDTDRTAQTAATTGTFQAFSIATGGDLISACMANVTVTGVAPDSIALDDMCGNATVLGDPKPPTFTFSGFVDNSSAGFRNLVQASLESPKATRYLLIDYGADVGYIFGQVEIGEMTITAAVNAGLQFSGSGIFTEIPTYSWALAAEALA
jgi:hypothetical protein